MEENPFRLAGSRLLLSVGAQIALSGADVRRGPENASQKIVIRTNLGSLYRNYRICTMTDCGGR